MTTAEKLSKIQIEFKAKKSRFNSFGKYNFRSAEDILEALKPMNEKYRVYFTIDEKYIHTDQLPIIETKASMFDIDENTFWTFFWMMAFTAIVALVAVLTDYYDSRNEYMTKLISEGADPIAVMCAFDDTKGDNPTCVMISTHQSK